MTMVVIITMDVKVVFVMHFTILSSLSLTGGNEGSVRIWCSVLVQGLAVVSLL